MIDNNLIEKFLEDNKENILNDIRKLVKVPSIRDLSTKTYKAPFGRGIREAFDAFIEIAKEKDFRVDDFDGYALHTEHGDGDEIVGILGHLDVVKIYNEDLWTSNPFDLRVSEGYIYGRGVNDDKGPIIGALYALMFLREMNVKFERKVRLILGGAEETTWECMDHYFKENVQPVMAFSPDGNFPIVNGEKGILYQEISKEEKTKIDSKHNLIEISTNEEDGFVCDYVKATFITNDESELINSLCRYTKVYNEGNKLIVEYSGERALSRNPDRAYNTMFTFVKDLENVKDLNSKGIIFKNIINKYFTDSINGRKLGVYACHPKMGETTICLMNTHYDEEGFNIKFDCRYPKGIKKDFVLKSFNKLCEIENMDIKVYKDLKLLYIEEDNELIKRLSTSYEKVFDKKPELFTKGAASYARALDNGVAFGPTIEGDKPNSHAENENIKIETLFKAIKVYVHAIYNLACIK